VSVDSVLEAVLLDALGTLLELEPPAPRLQDELARRFGVRVSEADAERAMAAEIAFYRTRLDSGKDPDSLAALRARCAEVVREQLPDSSALARVSTAALTEALLACLRFKVYPDVVPALMAARARGARLVVVSNWDASLAEVLARVELAPLLDGVLSSAQAGVRKPAPAIFEQALRIARSTAQHAVHVGDSLEEDIAGARAAGIEPILLRRDGGPGPPGVRTISSLAELENPHRAVRLPNATTGP
jgi:putative hydrolase of the HAD superfamily